MRSERSVARGESAAAARQGSSCIEAQAHNRGAGRPGDSLSLGRKREGLGRARRREKNGIENGVYSEAKSQEATRDSSGVS